MQFGSVNAIDTWVIIVIWDGSNNYSIYLMPIWKQAENIQNTAPLMEINAGLFSCPTIKTITLMCDFLLGDLTDAHLIDSKEKQCAL